MRTAAFYATASRSRDAIPSSSSSRVSSRRRHRRHPPPRHNRHVDSSLRVGGVTETVQVLAEYPLIDVAARPRAQTSRPRNSIVIPKGRSFQALATALPSVNSGRNRRRLSGEWRSAGENNFTVDGVSPSACCTGSPASGRRVRVSAGSPSEDRRDSRPSIGGALGGVISAVTKSGGNTFRGEGHYFYQRAARSAPVREAPGAFTGHHRTCRLSPGRRPGRSIGMRFGGTIGGPIVTDHLFFFGSVSPRIDASDTNDTLFSNGDGPGDRAGSHDHERVRQGELLASQPLECVFRRSVDPRQGRRHASPAYDGDGPQYQSSNAGQQRAQQDARIRDPAVELHRQRATYTPTNRPLSGAWRATCRDNYFDTGVPDKSQTFDYRDVKSRAAAGVPPEFQGADPAGYSNTPSHSYQGLTTPRPQLRDFQADYNAAFSAAGSSTVEGRIRYPAQRNDVDQRYPKRATSTIFWNQALRATCLASGPTVARMAITRSTTSGTIRQT